MAVVWIGETQTRKGKQEQMIVQKWPGGCSNSKWPPRKRGEEFTPQSTRTHTQRHTPIWLIGTVTLTGLVQLAVMLVDTRVVLMHKTVHPQ